MHHLLVSLRNAYQVHDSDLFEDLLKRVDKQMQPTATVVVVPRPPCVCAGNGMGCLVACDRKLVPRVR